MTTNDTRTARERAQEAALKALPSPTIDPEARTMFRRGYLARDAEPTTIAAEQIEKATKAMYEGSTGFKLTRGKPWSELSESTRETQLEYVRIAFRAAGFRIEGDDA